MSQAELKKAKQKRRKSAAMTLLEMEAPEARRQSSYFTSLGRYTLKDLLLTSLRSKSQPTATAALQLLQSLLLQYCTLCVDRLLVVLHDPEATTFPQPAILPDAFEDSPPPPSRLTDDDDDEYRPEDDEDESEDEQEGKEAAQVGGAAPRCDGGRRRRRGGQRSAFARRYAPLYTWLPSGNLPYL